MVAALSLEDLGQADRSELLSLWRARFKSPPPKSIGDVMVRRVLGFDVQAKTRGGLDRATKRALEFRSNRLSEMDARANPSQRGAPSSILPLEPKVSLTSGTRLIREWNGRTHVVEALEDGRFQYKDKTYRSLSQVAKTITGAHWSGPRFFGLVKQSKPVKSRLAKCRQERGI